MQQTIMVVHPCQGALSPEQSARYEKIRTMLCALYRRDQLQIHDRIIVFHDKLKAEYPDAREYAMFHLISGSTFIAFDGKFDFSSDDSVELFIEREYRKAFGLF